MTDYVIIDVDQFIQFRNNHCTPIDHIQLKANTLQKTFTCFQELTDTNTNVNTKNNTYPQSHSSGSSSGKWGKGQSFSRSNAPPPRQPPATRPDKLTFGGGSREISKEDRMKREFLAFINRLSEGNRKNIITYFENNLQVEFIDTYVRLLWEAMLRSEDFQELYIECFQSIYTLLCKNTDNVFIEKITTLWSTYVSDEKWLPSDALINEKDYDDFCDFVKWKKTSITYIHGFSKCVTKDWLRVTTYDNLSDKLIISIEKFLGESPEGCKVTDALLDQLLILVEYTKTSQDEPINAYIKTLHTNAVDYRPSTRFKIYDLKEFLERKVKFTVRAKKLITS